MFTTCNAGILANEGWDCYPPEALDAAPAWCAHATFTCEQDSPVSMLMEEGWLLIPPAMNEHLTIAERERDAHNVAVSVERAQDAQERAHDAHRIRERAQRIQRALSTAQWMLNALAAVTLVSMLRSGQL